METCSTANNGVLLLFYLWLRMVELVELWSLAAAVATYASMPRRVIDMRMRLRIRMRMRCGGKKFKLKTLDCVLSPSQTLKKKQLLKSILRCEPDKLGIEKVASGKLQLLHLHFKTQLEKFSPKTLC